MTEYNKTEKKIILDVANSLSVSSVRPFDTGDINEWHEYASKMKSVIDTVIPILTTLGNKGEELVNKVGLVEYASYLKKEIKEATHNNEQESIQSDRIGTKINQSEESL